MSNVRYMFSELPSDDDQLGAMLEAYFESVLSRKGAREGSCEGEAATLQPVLETLAKLSNLLKDSYSSEDDGGDDSLPVCFGKYVVKECLGRGGQAIVLLAEDPDTERSVVLKVHYPQVDGDDAERLLNEARNLARVKNAHVAECYGVDRHEGMPYLVMEHIRGRSLKEMLENDDKLTTEETVRIVAGVADGLAAVHARGILHGDIKPGNILMAEDGQPRLVDFGFSRPIASWDSQQATGTAAYMAPEQACNDCDRIDVRTDVFGLGAVFYELLAGEAPFAAETREESIEKARVGRIAPPRERDSRVSPRLAELCMQCLAGNPEDRLDAAELRTRLDRLERVRGRKRLLAGVAAALCAVIALVVFLSRPETLQTRPSAATHPTAVASVIPGPPDTSVLDLLQFDGQPRSDFNFTAEIAGRSPDENGVIQLRDQDIVQLKIEAAENCYVTILWLSEHDPPCQLFPDTDQFESFRDAAIIKNQKYVLPAASYSDESGPQPIIATPSTGKEALWIIAANRGIDLGDGRIESGRLVFDTPDQQEGLHARLRGFTRPQPKSNLRVSIKIFDIHVSANDD